MKAVFYFSPKRSGWHGWKPIRVMVPTPDLIVVVAVQALAVQAVVATRTPREGNRALVHDALVKQAMTTSAHIVVKKRPLGPWMQEKEKDEEAQAHMARGEEEEQSLLLACSSVFNLAPA
jgi:hypothetical protein